MLMRVGENRIAQQIKSKRKKEKNKKPAEPKEVTNRKSLANVRVIQRNLVYVTNLSVTIAKEEVGSPPSLPLFSP